MCPFESWYIARLILDFDENMNDKKNLAQQQRNNDTVGGYDETNARKKMRQYTHGVCVYAKNFHFVKYINQITKKT